MIHKVVSVLLLVSWMSVIFLLSGQVASDSDDMSIGISQKIVDGVEKVYPKSDLTAKDLNKFVRKNAHFISYMILGVLISNVFLAFGIKLSLWVVFLAVLYAATDEFHQSFVPGRGPSVFDVLIDGSGAMIGYLLFRLVLK